MHAPGQGSRRDGLRGIYAIGVALILIFVAGFVAKNVRLQWDLRTYRAAAECAIQGLDPYLLENLRAISGRPIELPFVYLPVALVPFLPFAFLPALASLWTWIGLKCIAIVALVLVWRLRFLPSVAWLPLALATVFGFNGALLWDLRSGNVALFEVTLLWLGFASYARHGRAWFGVLVAAAAMFKVTPIAFLVLLLAPAEQQPARGRLLVGLLLGFAAIMVGSTLVPPASSWSGFSTHLAQTFAAGDANPGFLPFIWAVNRTLGDPMTWPGAVTLWSVYEAALVALSIPWMVRAYRSRDPRTWVMGASLLFILLSPRPMAYGYLIAIPAILHFTQSLPGGRTTTLVVALLLSAQGLARVANHPLQGVLFHHLPFLIALGVWLGVAAGALRGPMNRAGESKTEHLLPNGPPLPAH
jgi:Glycosyltransferase family 87